MKPRSRYLFPITSCYQRSLRKFSLRSVRLLLAAICMCLSFCLPSPAAADAAIGHIASGAVQFSSSPLSGGSGGHSEQWDFLYLDTAICTPPAQCLFEQAYRRQPLPQPLELSTVYLDNVARVEMSNAAQGDLELRQGGNSYWTMVSSRVTTIVELSPMTSLTVAIPVQLSLATAENSISALAFWRLDVGEVGRTPIYNRFFIEAGPESSIDAQRLLSTTFVNDTLFTKTLEVLNYGTLDFAGSLIPEPSTWMMFCAGLLLTLATRVLPGTLRKTRQFFLRGLSVFLVAFAYTNAGADELGTNATFGSLSMLNGSGQQLDYSIFWTRLYNSACGLDGECRTRDLTNVPFPADTSAHSGESSSYTVVEAATTGGSMEIRVPPNILADTHAAALALVSLQWTFMLSPGDTARITVPVELALIGNMPPVSSLVDSATASLELSNGRTRMRDELSITSEGGPGSLSDTLAIAFANTTPYTDFFNIQFTMSTSAWEAISVVPEPRSYAMLCAGFLSLLIIYFRRIGRCPIVSRMQRFTIDKNYNDR